MIATIGHSIRLTGATTQQATALRQRLTLPNPLYQRRLRLGLSVWGVTPTICYLGKDGHTLIVPRGLAREIHPSEQRDRSEWGDRVTYSRGRVTLRPYQTAAARALVQREQGIVVAACGAGKTVIACEAIRTAATTTLIVVHTADLAAQWAEVIERELGWVPVRLGGRGGQASGKRSDTSPAITVATIQTLTRLGEADLDRVLKTGCLIVDEAHHVPASTFDRVVSRSPSRYRWALTATPDRVDGLGPVLGFLFGDVLSTISGDDLARTGVLVRPQYRQVRTGRTCDESDYSAIVTALSVDERRDEIIVDLATRATGPTLVLVARVAHAKALALALGCRSLTGSDTPSDRAEVIDAIRAGRERVLVATTVADEGLDLPCLTTLILGTPSRARGRLEQRIGRVCRAYPGKSEAYVYDLVDGHSLLLSQARARAQAVKEIWP